MVKYFIPAFRALLAKELVEKRGLSQIEVARKLGITQAAISQYIHLKRGRKTIKALNDIPEVRQLISIMAVKITSSKEDEELDFTNEICQLCRTIRPKLMKLVE